MLLPLARYYNNDNFALDSKIFAMKITRIYEKMLKTLFAQFPAVVVTFIFRRCPIWFWRTARGDEVDLIIEKDGRFTTTECKYAKAISSSGLKGLNAFTETYGHENNRNCYVASRTATEHPWS